MPSSNRLSKPLSDKEFQELDDFLLSDFVSDETMMIDCLDGFLTALAVGPETVLPSKWLPRVWGGDSEEHFPKFKTGKSATGNSSAK